MPLASLTAARDAILTLFKVAWDAQTPPVPKLLNDDVKDDLPAGTFPWARIIVRHNTGFQATLAGETGNRRFRRLGLVTVQIFTPYGDGLDLNDALAKVAVDAFEGKSTAADEVLFRNVRSNEVGQDGNWFQTNVFAEFEYDEVK